MIPTALTGNQAPAYEHSLNHHLEFFSKAGSLLEKRESFYGNESSALDLFKAAWYAGNQELSMKLLLWLRDIRGGAGNRSGFKAIINWLANTQPEWIKANIAAIPEVGRWDDLFALYKTPVESHALALWAEALVTHKNGLAAKWAARQDAKLREFMNLSPKKFRKLLVSLTNVIETPMCSGKWETINYNHTPSVAATRYNKAFAKNDPERYKQWKEALKKKDGSAKVNAGAVFPHDIIRMVLQDARSINSENAGLADAMFEALPNYLEGVNSRIMTICDFSGSMYTAHVSGNIRAIDVCLGLGLYCSDKLGPDNPFYRNIIPFSSNARFESWKGMSIADAVIKIPDGYCGSTNIQSALNLILDSARMFKVSNDQIPNILLIISDMQFDGMSVSDVTEEKSFVDPLTESLKYMTPIEEALSRWTANGYSIPKIGYWNTAGYKSQSATTDNKDVALIRGFSPSVLKAVFAGKFDPISVMLNAVSKYNISIP